MGIKSILNNKLIIGELYELQESLAVRRYSENWAILSQNRAFTLNDKSIVLYVKSCPFRGASYPLFLHDRNILMPRWEIDISSINALFKRISE